MASEVDVTADGTAASVSVRADPVALRRFAILLTGRQADADDLLQEAWARMLAATNAGTEVDHPTAYLRRTMTGLFLNGRRREMTWAAIAPTLWTRGLQADAQDHVALAEQLSAALRHLTGKQLAAVILRYYADLSYSEVAAEMSIPESTARSLVRRGLRTMRITIEGESDQ